MLEEKVLRLFVYMMGLYALVSGIHLGLSAFVFKKAFSPWIITALGEVSVVAYIFVAASIVTGAGTLFAAYFNKRKFLLVALSSMVVYQVFLFCLNILEYSGRGTPAVSAVFVGALAAVLYAYYSEKPDALAKPETEEGNME